MAIPDSFLVCVKCMTFNHHAYITDAMNGFVIQKTNFPYLCIIVDDCSTDGEQDVIRQYFKDNFELLLSDESDDCTRNLGKHQTNDNCYFLTIYLKYNHYSIKKSKISYYSEFQDNAKYAALCEGDDYWIAEKKLQMQVDFLEENDEYGLCYTRAKCYSQKNNRFLKYTKGEFFDGFEDLLKRGDKIPTLTVCMRTRLWKKYMDEIKPLTRGWLMGDYPLWLYFTHEAKAKFFDTVSAVYRILENSASHPSAKDKIVAFRQSVHSVRYFFGEYYNVENNRSILIDYYFYMHKLKECCEIDVSGLLLKYKIKAFSCKSIILHNVLFAILCKINK